MNIYSVLDFALFEVLSVLKGQYLRYNCEIVVYLKVKNFNNNKNFLNNL